MNLDFLMNQESTEQYYDCFDLLNPYNALTTILSINKRLQSSVTFIVVQNNKMNNNIENARQLPIATHAQTQKLPNQIKASFVNHNLVGSGLSFQLLSKSSLLNQKCSLCKQIKATSEMACISNCKHLFCSICLLRYANYKMDAMEDVICPQEGCTALLPQNSKLFEYLPPNAKQNYKKNIAWKRSKNNPSIKICSKSSCQGTLGISQDNYQCNKCLTQYCKKCQLLKHEGTCEYNFNQLFKYRKPCPSCKAFIQQKPGWNHMICKCSYQFCYLCLAKWQESHRTCRAQKLPNQQLAFELQVAKLNCWSRFWLGLQWLIVIPILAVVILVILPFSLAFTTIKDLCLYPGQIISTRYQEGTNRIYFCIFTIFFILFATIVDVVKELINGLRIIWGVLSAMLKHIRIYWCSCRKREDQGVQMELQEQLNVN